MKFFLDESVPFSLRTVFEDLGFKVEDVKTSGLRGADDATIADYAQKNKAILVTHDLEFGSMLLYPKGSHHGCIILRLPFYFKVYQLAESLKTFLREIEKDDLVGSVTILELGRFRVRRFSNGADTLKWKKKF